MTKHAQVSEGDRHVPVDRVFANAAARLAYQEYETTDVGKWYQDSDTGAVHELTSALYLSPAFRQWISQMYLSPHIHHQIRI